MQWVKKETLSNTIAEEISDKQVSHRCYRPQEKQFRPHSAHTHTHTHHTHTHTHDGVMFSVLQYEDLISRLSQLAAHPHSNRSKEFLDRYHRPLFSYRAHAKVAKLGEGGEASAVGRRKTSTAHVTLKPGGGEVRINGRSLLEYFPVVEDRQQVLFPLMATEKLDQFDVKAAVSGGGTTGEPTLILLPVLILLLPHTPHTQPPIPLQHTLPTLHISHPHPSHTHTHTAHRSSRCNPAGHQSCTACISW